jgi:hypothetical protein
MYLFIFLLICILAIYPYLSLASPSVCLEPSYTTITSEESGPTIALIGSVHGNEPAGAYTLLNLVHNLKVKKGKVILIAGNPCGVAYDTRMNPYSWNDINREFYDSSYDHTARKILELLHTNKVDVIVDFHEGWGWYTQNNLFGSIGSTLSPSPQSFWKDIVPSIIDELNTNLVNEKKFAIRWNMECDTSTKTLQCYAHKHDIPYMLVETSGQNNIQPIEDRIAQDTTIVRYILNYLGMI